MLNINFLLSMPGGSEWVIIMFLFLFVLICPVLAIVFYLQAKRLKQENSELLARLFDKGK